MNICRMQHDVVCYDADECPLCKVMNTYHREVYIDKLERKIEILEKKISDNKKKKEVKGVK